MKKIILVLTAAALAVTMCACGGNNNGGSTESTASSVSSAAPAASAELDLQKALEKVKAEIKMPATTSDYTAARLKRTFGLDEEKVAEFAGMFCDDGVTQDRIIYIKAKTEADVPLFRKSSKMTGKLPITSSRTILPNRLRSSRKRPSIQTDCMCRW